MMHGVLKHYDIMIGLDFHTPWPKEAPKPLEGVVWPNITCMPLIGTGLHASYAPTCVTLGGWTMQMGTDIGPLIPHVPIPGLSLLTPLDILFSTSISVFGAGNVLVEGQPVAAALLGIININLNCGAVPTPTGLVFAFTTHFVGMSLMDILFGLLSMAVQIALGAVLFVAPMAAGWAGKAMGRVYTKHLAGKAVVVATKRFAGRVAAGARSAGSKVAAGARSALGRGKALGAKGVAWLKKPGPFGTWLKGKLQTASQSGAWTKVKTTLGPVTRRVSGAWRGVKGAAGGGATWSKAQFARLKKAIVAWWKAPPDPNSPEGKEILLELLKGLFKFWLLDPLNRNAQWLGIDSPLAGTDGNSLIKTILTTMGIDEWGDIKLTPQEENTS